MRRKKFLFGLLLAFVLLLGGAYALYTWLGQSMAPAVWPERSRRLRRALPAPRPSGRPPRISPSTTGRETRSICPTTPASRWC